MIVEGTLPLPPLTLNTILQGCLYTGCVTLTSWLIVTSSEQVKDSVVVREEPDVLRVADTVQVPPEEPVLGESVNQFLNHRSATYQLPSNVAGISYPLPESTIFFLYLLDTVTLADEASPPRLIEVGETEKSVHIFFSNNAYTTISELISVLDVNCLPLLI